MLLGTVRKDISSERDAPSLVVRSSIGAVAGVFCTLGVSGGCAMEVIKNEVNVMSFGLVFFFSSSERQLIIHKFYPHV